MVSRQFQPSPYLKASAWSRLFHGYIFLRWNSLLSKSRRSILSSWISQLLDKSHKAKTLQETDLYNLLPEYESVQLTDHLEKNWFDEMKHNPDEPSLFRATIRTMRWKPLIIASTYIPKVGKSMQKIAPSMSSSFQKIATLVRPLLIIYLMKFFEPCSTMSTYYAVSLAFLTVVSAAVSTVFHHTVSAVCLSVLLCV